MTRFNLRWFRTSLPVVFLALFPPTAESQVVQGVLVDDGSGEPITAANIRLLRGETGNSVIQRAITGEDGGFILALRAGGRVRLGADRIGYQEVVSPPFDLVESDTLEVELRMAVAAVPLAPLTVVSTRAPLIHPRSYVISGFLDRKDTYGVDGLGLGVFLERDSWEHRSPGIVADLAREIPGVRVVGTEIRMRITSIDPRGCIPEYYLDGIHIRMMSERSLGVTFKDTIDEFVHPSEIAAIEVYNGISKPAQFMDMGAHPCGAVVIWTR